MMTQTFPLDAAQVDKMIAHYGKNGTLKPWNLGTAIEDWLYDRIAF